MDNGGVLHTFHDNDEQLRIALIRISGFTYHSKHVAHGSLLLLLYDNGSRRVKTHLSRFTQKAGRRSFAEYFSTFYSLSGPTFVITCLLYNYFFSADTKIKLSRIVRTKFEGISNE